MPPKKKVASTNDASAAGGGPNSKKQRRGSTSGANDNNNNNVSTKEKEETVVTADEKETPKKNANQLKIKTDVSSTTKTAKHIKITPVAGSGSAMDNHPYARGSVIEVLHGVKEKDETEEDSFGEEKKDALVDDFDDWWEQDSDEEEEEENENSSNGEDEKDENETKKKTEKETTISVRLCDVIDRVAVESSSGEEGGEQRWRYYVHYKDFNRRMDEWISMDRIVSPPSIGNAKARAIKREEEKKKRMLQREKEKEEKRRAAMEARSVDVSAPRASRRRSTAGAGPPNTNASPSNGANTANAEGGAAAEGNAASSDAANPSEEGTRRGTRMRRRSTAAGGEADEANKDNSEDTKLPMMAAEKGTVALSTAADSTKVGEHVVQTIAAQELDEHEGLDDAALREHEEVTKVKNVAFLELGAHQMSTWYFSPLPKELLSEQGYIEVLHVCEFTLRMFSRKQEIRRFQARLPPDRRHPPGNEIYRCGNLSMFEVDGFEERIYCQNLCYIAKLFLDHKTLYFDVDPFLFYVLCEVDERGFHPVGYYSKEKYSDVGYNLACILTFPSHQRKGYGRFLIAFSYELSKKEEKVGSPEKPMSDLGQQAYKPYWASTIVDFLLNQCPNANNMSIMDISKMTSIMAEDIVFTLNQLSILKIINGVYFIAAEEGLLRTLAKKYPVKNPRVDPSKLHWTPFVTDVKRDKFSIHSKKPSVEGEETRGSGGF